MTLFDVLSLGSLGAGIRVGATLGSRAFGPVGGWVGGVVGGLVGFVVGRVPLAITLWYVQRKLARKTVEELRVQLHNQYFVAHEIMGEFIRRGVDPSPDRSYILELLASDSADRRRFGFAALHIGFPEIADQLGEFRPGESTEVCRDKLVKITTA